MDKQTESAEDIQPTQTAKKSKAKSLLVSLLILILIMAAAGASYWWRDKTAKDLEKKQAADISSLQQIKASLEKQLTDEKAKNTKTTDTADKTVCTPKAPSAVVTDNIKASITSGNTAALEGYMASSVNVIIAASEGLGAKSPTQAVSAITDFISSDTASWDYNFALSASVLSSYGKGSYSQYFPGNAVVGKATNKKVISFSFDCNAKISTVFLSASEDLLK